VTQQGADADRQEDAAALDRRARDLGEDRGRCAFHHHVGQVGQLAQRHHRHLGLEPGHVGPGLVRVAGGHRHELQPLDAAAVERRGHFLADRPKSSDADRKRSRCWRC